MDKVVYSVSLHQIVTEFRLEILSAPEDWPDKLITSDVVSRPAFPLSGYYEFFDPTSIQVIGAVENRFLSDLSPEKRREVLERLYSTGIPMMVVTRGLDSFAECSEMAQKYGVVLARTSENTTGFVAALTAALNVHLGPRTTMHGVFVEVYGEGILLLGDSGVGKSETAIELVKRGHRLVADDAVDIKRVSAKTLVGSAPEMIRYFIELRGIGIIDVRRIFGMGSVKPTEKVDVIIHLEQWDDKKPYDRLGADEKLTEILGIQVPSLEIPVKPGRNLAVIIEVAAMNNRNKKMGHNAAKELSDKIYTSMIAAQENQK